MASELEQQRDHCRRMATASTELVRPKGTSSCCQWAPVRPDWWPFAEAPEHRHCPRGWQSCACTCHDPDRPQPPTDAERLLWTQLADEIDAYLARDDEPALWEDA